MMEEVVTKLGTGGPVSDTRESGWKKGPLPPGTWNWGGVVPVGMDVWGFLFADFHGDHVTIVAPGHPNDKKRLEANEIAYYNNSLCLPPCCDPKSGTRQ